jgi:hypothetical protein
MVDCLASEYGWSIDYAMGVPCDVSAQLLHAILYRKGVVVFRNQDGTGEPTGSLANKLESIFEDN